MRINNNLNAMTALNQMGRNTALAGTSMNKIASGERINKAGDDAAGMAISEKMRGQIRGLDQASKNAQDGISVVQTAEGAMEEIGNITQRMRELTVQASNETNSVEDREKITTELKQLHSEIDRIAESTQFNGKQLLSNGVEAGGLTNESKISGKATEVATITTKGFEGEFVSEDIKLSVTKGGTGKEIADAVVTVKLGTEEYEAKLGADGKTITATKGDKEITIELATAVGTGSIDIAEKVAGKLETTVANGNAEVSGNGVTGSEIKGFTDEKFKNAKFELTKTDANEYSLKILDQNGKTLATADKVTIAAKKLSFTDIKDENGKALVGHSVSLDVEGTKLDAQATLDSLGKVNLDFKTSTDALNMNLQIGANTGDSESLNVKIANMSTSALGLGKTDIEALVNTDLAKGTEAAKALIDKLDSALETVNTSRANLGATQNRLETAQSNLTTSSENLTAAESRIRDVDVAKEMMNLSKLNLLSQASQAMAGQAKQQPEGVMQLLR